MELAEVEQAIMSGREDEGIWQCTAVTINGTLVALISCDTDGPLAESEDLTSRLRHRLSKTLFSASIPQAIIQLQDFPMNLNGKVDAKALEQIYAKRTSHREAILALASVDHVDDRVEEEWRQILQLGPNTHIQATDNFFGLGGHSVLVLLANRLSTAFEVELLKQLLQVKPT